MDPTNNLNNQLVLIGFGSVLTLIATLINAVISHFMNKSRADEDRKKDFELRLTELRIAAASKAFQYVLRINRAYVRNQTNTSRADKLTIEARDWLDGEALILGDEIYKAVYFYFNTVLDPNSKSSEKNTALANSTDKIRSVLKNK